MKIKNTKVRQAKARDDVKESYKRNMALATTLIMAPTILRLAFVGGKAVANHFNLGKKSVDIDLNETM